MKVLQAMSFPGGSVIKNAPVSAGDMGSIPRSGRSPGEGNGNPLQYSCLGIPWTEEIDGLQSIGLQINKTGNVENRILFSFPRINHC